MSEVAGGGRKGYTSAMKHNLVRLSKTVSHALRHAPWLYELELDDESWTPVEDLLAALRAHRERWRDLTEDDLALMVATSDKQRFEMRGGLIRAHYGHSLPRKLSKTPARPPELLYHGTGERALDAILTGGLKPMGRQYVHLSVDVETAQQVGRRKGGRTFVLTVRAGEAHERGITFYEGNEIVWLADHVPPEFIDAPQV
jgi:putative RNA 2'-phosphotransferase